MSGNDEAGKMLGWSLATGMPKKELEELITLPGVFSFKVIGTASKEYQAAILEEVQKSIGRPLEEKEFETRTSAEGKYVSITLHLQVTTVEEIYALYALLKANPGTRFVL
jgi:putative lipoic acid-binding regulatory protein